MNANSRIVEATPATEVAEIAMPESIRYNSYAKINVAKFMHFKHIFQTVQTGDTVHLKNNSRVNPNTYHTYTFEVGVKGWGIARNHIVREGVKLLDGKAEYGLLKLHHAENAGTDKVLRLYLTDVYGMYEIDDPQAENRYSNEFWRYWKNYNIVDIIVEPLVKASVIEEPIEQPVEVIEQHMIITCIHLAKATITTILETGSNTW